MPPADASLCVSYRKIGSTEYSLARADSEMWQRDSENRATSRSFKMCQNCGNKPNYDSPCKFLRYA